MSSFWAMTRKEFWHILRDPSALAIVTVGASLLLVLMAYTFSADIEQVPVAVLDQDRSPQSRAYLQQFGNDKFFNLRYWPQSQADTEKLVKMGQAKAAIIVPHGFGYAIRRGEKTTVQIIIDGLEPNTAYQIMGNAEALSTHFSVELLTQKLDSLGLVTSTNSQPLEFRVRALFNPNLREINCVFPGLMAIMLAMPALAAALSLSREKEQGSLEGLIATPIRGYQLLAGKVVPYILIGLADIVLFLLIATLLFKIRSLSIFRGTSS